MERKVLTIVIDISNPYFIFNTA
jgi:trans-aconitate methyltransferase